VLFSSDWYSTLAQHSVDVVIEPVVEVLPEGVRSGYGQVQEVDVIIYGTGFAATEFLAPIQVTGVDGADLQARWKTGARAYLGLCVPDFPNLFVVYGPNTNLGGSSIINMLEAASGARSRPCFVTPRGRAHVRSWFDPTWRSATTRDPEAPQQQRLGQLPQLAPPG